jgi:hypothetical protein
VTSSHHLRTEKNPVIETLYFLVFRTTDGGQRPEPKYFRVALCKCRLIRHRNRVFRKRSWKEIPSGWQIDRHGGTELILQQLLTKLVTIRKCGRAHMSIAVVIVQRRRRRRRVQVPVLSGRSCQVWWIVGLAPYCVTLHRWEMAALTKRVRTLYMMERGVLWSASEVNL